MTDSLVLESGIYCFYCKEEEKRYIGQAINLKNRKQQHLDALTKNKHINKKLQDAWNAYGPLEYSVIEYAPSFKLNHLEDLYIKAFNSVNEGYNQINGTTKVIVDGEEILKLTQNKEDIMSSDYVIRTIFEPLFDLNKEAIHLEPYLRLKKLIEFLTDKCLEETIMIEVFDTLNIECFDLEDNYIPEPTPAELSTLKIKIHPLKLNKKQLTQIRSHNDKLRSEVSYRLNCSIDALKREYYNFCIEVVDSLDHMTLSDIKDVNQKKNDYKTRISELEDEKVKMQSDFLVVY